MHNLSCISDISRVRDVNSKCGDDLIIDIAKEKDQGIKDTLTLCWVSTLSQQEVFIVFKYKWYNSLARPISEFFGSLGI